MINDPGVWVAACAVGISALTLIANQLRIKKIEAGESSDTVFRQITELRERIKDLIEENRKLQERCDKLEFGLSECRSERLHLLRDNLALSAALRKALGDKD